MQLKPKMLQLISFLAIIHLSCVTSQTFVTIGTKLGNVTGLSMSVSDGKHDITINSFRNVPYGKAPVGDLRFRNPEPFGSWNITLNGTMFGPSCMQFLSKYGRTLLQNKRVSEDCLNLNIYQPINASSQNQKSVMIWIHGGGYSFGQGALYDGSYLAAIGDVIVVTINYRLNIFGFLSTMDSLSPGNYGLFDQKLAIEWVFNNIDDYGGDKTSITIFGESAGGNSVGLQALNPDNKGFFNRVIAQSGIGNSFFATSTVSRRGATVLSNVINCPTPLTTDTLRCLRGKSSDELLNALPLMSDFFYKDPLVHNQMSFGPVVDRIFLSDNPQNILQKKSAGFQFFKSLDVMIGNCDSEGNLLIGDLQYRNVSLLNGISRNYFCDNIISTFVSDFYQNLTYLKNPICEFYRTNGSIADQSMAVINFYGDAFMYAPAVQSLNFHATESNKKAFQYMSTRSSIWSLGKDAPPWFKGSGHASELPFLFPFSPLSNQSADDRATSLTMIKYWSNFAKTGDVNDGSLPVWPHYEMTTKQYADINAKVVSKQHLYKERMHFWLETFPSLLERKSNSATVLSFQVWILICTLVTLI